MIKKFLFLICVLCVVSCDTNRIYDTYTTLENREWAMDQPVLFDFSVTDTIQPKNVFINLRNNSEYPYRNLFLITKITSPDHTQKIDTLEYEIYDVYGRSLGNGLTDVKESQLYFLEHFVFPKSGGYQVEVSHAMRQRGQAEGIKKLQGIVDIGLRIESIE